MPSGDTMTRMCFPKTTVFGFFVPASNSNSEKIAASLAGRRAILLLSEPARTDEAPAPGSTRSVRPRTVELDMDIERADAFAIHGETASGVPRSVTVSDVRSISYATDHVLTGVLGALAGACVLGVGGSV